MVEGIGLLPQIKAGAFGSVVFQFFPCTGKIFTSEVFQCFFLEVGRHIHREEFDPEMFSARPGEYNSLGEIECIPGHELHDAVTAVTEGVRYPELNGLISDRREFNDIPCLDHDAKEAVIVRIGSALMLIDRYCGKGDGEQFTCSTIQYQSGKLYNLSVVAFRLSITCLN